MEDSKHALLGSVSISQEAAKEMATINNVVDLKNKIVEYASGNTTNLLDIILAGAVKLGGSDIHIEPQEDTIRLRMRLDGILQDTATLEKITYEHLLSRLKLLSKLKLNITNKPQDGRFSVAMDEALVEVRTSSLPAEYGEAIVMRVLNPANFMELEHLGLRPDLYKTLEKEIKKPNGMIVVTGPTGSGKTTTLYAFLMKLQNPEMKIITIEDPIEYHLKGVSQTQASAEKGYSFAEGLKSIVRQDPDVILVGEIRDLETAETALQAALTGHLVLSTMHTNDAAGTIPRFIDLKTKPSSIASALTMAVGQRLVRKVCKECSVLEAPSESELAEIKKGLVNLEKNEDLALPKNLDDIKLTKANKEGCAACNFTGYKGRMGLYELFLVDNEMERFILENPPVSQIKELLVKKGMITIWQSGLIEVAKGATTLEEVKKVVEADE